MLITPALLHVKTHTGRGRRDSATHPWLAGATESAGQAGRGPDDLLSRLDVQVLPRGPEATEWDCIRLDHASMADAGEWDDLLEELRFADQERRMASGGRRLSHLISEGARRRIRAAMAAGDRTEVEAELRRFEAVHALHATDYAAVHLLAEAEIDLGLLLLLSSDRDSEAEAKAHLAKAERLLADFDPIAEFSPLLAATRYRLLPGLDDGPALARDWHADWCDLDPEDAQAHIAHASHLVTMVGASVAAVERAARRASAMTEEIAGRSAYAIFHLTAHARLGAPLPLLDVEMLVQGLADFQAGSGCQHRANVAASFLTDLLRALHPAGLPVAQTVARIRDALSDLLQNRLCELHLESWTHGAEGLTFALDAVFGPALRKGARIQRAGSGLGARIPRN